MDENWDCRFLEDEEEENLHNVEKVTPVPVVFIYDRTAALDEGDDQKDALLYPILVEEDEVDAVITRQIHLIGQIIGLVSKLELELGCSLPAICKLQDMHFYLLHVGKYTLSLRRPPTYPATVAKQELELVYFLFSTFYGGFSTAKIPTTESKLVDNPDKDKAKYFHRLLQFITKINRPQIAECLGCWSFETPFVSSTSLTTRKLASSLTLLVESLTDTESVVGVLAMIHGKLLITKNLKPRLAQSVLLILSGELEEFGIDVEFPVGNVTVRSCRLTQEHLYSQNGPDPHNAMIHIRGDLSLTLFVRSEVDPTADDSFRQLWRRPCTRLKDELLHMYHKHDCRSTDGDPTIPLSSASSVQVVQLNKSTNTALIKSSSSVLTMDSRSIDRRKVSIMPLTLSNQLWQDWYMKSVAIAQQTFSDMPSVTEVRLGSPSDAVLHASKGLVSNDFVGANDIRTLNSFATNNI